MFVYTIWVVIYFKGVLLNMVQEVFTIILQFREATVNLFSVIFLP